jgi:hypothetical protein
MIKIRTLRNNLNIAKVEDALDPRRQGRSPTKVLRALDNPGDAALYGFSAG